MNAFLIRKTENNKLIGAIRIMLGVMFVMTGFMKIALSTFGAAWEIQLIEAGIPLKDFIVWFIPVIEIIIGSVLLAGYYSRIGALIIMPIMIVGIYVHLTVSNPQAFPAQPQQPYVPIVVLALAAAILVRGGGSWSKDLIVNNTES